MKRGPTKATMERLLAEKRAAAELVTDWIPCTTPPVRDGDYDIQLFGDEKLRLRVEFVNGVWRYISGCLTGTPLVGPGIDGECWHWRGVRRWVLVRKADPLMTALNQGEPVDVYLISARPRSAAFGGLGSRTRPFKTEAAAQRFADRYSRLGLTAVLP